MIVTGLVLGAVLLSILGLIASFITQRRVVALDESSIDNVAQLDAAMAIPLAVDHLAHPSIAVISIVPAFFIVLTARASRRRYAQRQLDTYLRSEPSSRTLLSRASGSSSKPGSERCSLGCGRN